MCGGGAPEDHSAEVAQIQADAEEKARLAAEEERRRQEELAKAEEAKKEQTFNSALTGGYQGAIQSAKQYFTSQGVNWQDYANAVRQQAQATRGTVPFLDANPGSYFTGLGQDVFNQEQEGYRTKSLNTLKQLFNPTFSTDRVADTADDDIINAILGEQKTEAQKYIDNLLARGVITDAGYQGALKNLENQSAGAKSTLSTLGTNLLTKERGDLDNLVTSAQQQASNLSLGDIFDPFSYKSKANKSIQDFLAGLSDSLRGAAPTNLFDTSGLANVAGAAQGAQNTPFDPNALAGVFDSMDNKDDEEKKTNAGSFAASGSPFA